jgi:uncharacterized protein (DUF58 family)
MADGIPKPPVIRASPPPLPPRIPPPPVIPPPPRIQPILRRIAAPVARVVVKPAAPPLLTLAELERFKNLLVFAKSTVEGYFTGKHRSPYRGSSVEFADYKEYVPGDELNRIDWRAYGRTRRLFVRQYEAETDMVIYLLVDVSASMSYAGTGRQSKYILAAKVAAALAYLMIHQGDKAALGLFGETLSQFHPPGGTRRHLHNLITSLERVKPAAGTGLAQALHEAGPLFKKRGRIVSLSDFWTDPKELFDSLGEFLHRNFEILLLHVMDPDELNLPAANTARFRDMETHEEVEVEPEEIRRAYRQTVDERIQFVAREANSRRISHSLVNTAHPYVDAIEAYLGFRGRNNLLTR